MSNAYVTPSVFSEPLRACIGHWNIYPKQDSKATFLPSFVFAWGDQRRGVPLSELWRSQSGRNNCPGGLFYRFTSLKEKCYFKIMQHVVNSYHRVSTRTPHSRWNRTQTQNAISFYTERMSCSSVEHFALGQKALWLTPKVAGVEGLPLCLIKASPNLYISLPPPRITQRKTTSHMLHVSTSKRKTGSLSR